MTERDEALVRDCVFASGLMLAWWAGEPVTINRAHREAIARAAGMPEGKEAAGPEDLNRGFEVLYGWTGRIIDGTWTDIEKLPDDAYCVLLGLVAALPAHYFPKGDPFRGLHAVGYRPFDGWWQDPETLPSAIASGFNGEVIPPAAARAYAQGWPGGRVHALWIRRNEVAPVSVLPVTDPAPVFVDLPAGAQLYDSTFKALVKLSKAATVVSPFVSGLSRAVVITTGGVRQLLFAHLSDCKNPRPLSDPGGVSAIKAKVAAFAADVADD